jgi:hypothetical protein
MQRFFAILTCVVVAACGGGNGSPTAPSTPARATLTISAFTVTASTLAAGGFSYRAVFQLRETGGRMGATILTIRFTQQDGRFVNTDPTSAVTIAAGGTLDSGAITLTDSTATTPTTQFTLSIGYRDDGGPDWRRLVDRDGTAARRAAYTATTTAAAACGERRVSGHRRHHPGESNYLLRAWRDHASGFPR